MNINIELIYKELSEAYGVPLRELEKFLDEDEDMIREACIDYKNGNDRGIIADFSEWVVMAKLRECAK